MDLVTIPLRTIMIGRFSKLTMLNSETSAASPSAEDIVMVANHLSFAKYGLDPDVNCFPERKYVKGEYPNEEIDQSKITGPVCWRMSRPFLRCLVNQGELIW